MAQQDNAAKLTRQKERERPGRRVQMSEELCLKIVYSLYVIPRVPVFPRSFIHVEEFDATQKNAAAPVEC
ncbi:hypothetical protein VTL71DRAFT_1059 [Oculimacula yallundae]|uniref:Uncharacterized protein n=1 Tax=Oculimacula yallundae TaxID=86028 RepID=A0ABR4D2X3_9HELO